MSELTIEQLKRKIKQLEDQAPFVVKEGEICYCNNPESPTATFTKIEFGLNCSFFFNGKEQKDYISVQISKSNKELFAEFDQTSDTKKYKVGDRIKITADLSSYQTNIDKRNGNRMCIYNNVTLVRAQMIEPGALLPSEKPGAEPDFFEAEKPTEEITPF